MGTGTTDIIKRCLSSGLRTPDFIQDDDFRTILWRPTDQERDQKTGQKTGHETGHERDQVRDQESDQVSDHVSDHVKKLIKVIRGDTKTREETMLLMNIKSRRYFRENYLKAAINSGYVAMLYPDALRRTDQAYYLTTKGLELLRKLKKSNK